MQTQWSNWLAAESAAGRSGIVLSGHPIVRGQAYELVLPIPADVSGDAFDGAQRLDGRVAFDDGPRAWMPPLDTPAGACLRGLSAPVAAP